MFFKYLCILVLWTKVPSALEGLISRSDLINNEMPVMKKGFVLFYQTPKIRQID